MTMFKRRTVLIMLWLATCSAYASASQPVKVVYHLNEAGYAQALRAINFLANHLGADPGAQIVVVAQADGVFFLSTQARTDDGNSFLEAVTVLQRKGVRFEACNLSLLSRGVRAEQLIPGVKVVTSGVAELARLQASEGYAYIRP